MIGRTRSEATSSAAVATSALDAYREPSTLASANTSARGYSGPVRSGNVVSTTTRPPGATLAVAHARLSGVPTRLITAVGRPAGPNPAPSVAAKAGGAAAIP